MNLNGVILHQCLHGYDDGHRLLASSIQLPPSDSKTVLQFSDSAGSGIRNAADEYVTGYPLRFGLYAIARTWPAPEKPRPGCVWTHTLLLDFADLAVIPDLGALARLFTRPVGTLEHFKQPLSIDEIDEECPRPAEPEMAAVLAALYEYPSERVIAPRLDRDRSENLAFGIWSQQWPRLRRAFRFCTNSISDRSTESHVFDLQLSANEGSFRSRFPKSRQVSPANRPFPLWLESALEDLKDPNTDGLRSFLRGVGGDVDHGRRSFTSLVQLHADLQGKDTNFSLLADAINLLTNDLRDVEASDLRASVAETASRHVPALDQASVDFLIKNLASLEARDIDQAALGRELILRSPELLGGLLSNGGFSGTIAVQGLKAFTMDQALDLAVRHPGTLPPIIEAKPELYGTVEFWKLPAVSVAGAVKAASLACHPVDVVKAVIAAGRDDLVNPVYGVFGARTVLSVVAERYSAGTPGNLSAWLSEGVRDLNALSAVLASGSTWSAAFLAQIAHLVSPDAVPNDVGDDPWLTAIRFSKDVDGDNFLGAYLLTRALGQRTRNSAELSTFGFASVHEATARGWLRDDAWSMLSPRLPHALLGFDWDRCWRLRAALVDLFVDRRLSPKVLAHAPFGNELFFSLAHWACRGKRGRELMRAVADELKASGNSAKAKELSSIVEDKWPF